MITEVFVRGMWESQSERDGCVTMGAEIGVMVLKMEEDEIKEYK